MVEIVDLVTIVMGFLITALTACTVYLFRNKKVLEESIRVLNLVHELSDKDIHAGKDYKWRYENYDLIEYEDLLWAFWKPVTSYYKDMDCLKETQPSPSTGSESVYEKIS